MNQVNSPSHQKSGSSQGSYHANSPVYPPLLASSNAGSATKKPSLKVKFKIPVKKQKSTLCNRMSRQVGGTCWFHAIINGFLLSNIGRAVMRRQLYEYKKAHNISQKNWASCPAYGRLPKGLLMYYIDYFFSHRKRPFRNNKVVIGNVRVHRPIEGGYARDIVKVIRAIFGKGSIYHKKEQNKYYGRIDVDRSKIRAKFSVMSSSGPHIAPGKPLQLMFINITALGGKYAHVITGFKCGNTNYIYDSNNSRIVKLDWTASNRVELLRRYFMGKYPNSYNNKTEIVFDYVFKI